MIARRNLNEMREGQNSGAVIAAASATARYAAATTTTSESTTAATAHVRSGGLTSPATGATVVAVSSESAAMG